MAADRPRWCPLKDRCTPVVSFQGQVCGGRLVEARAHNDDFNTHALCMSDEERPPTLYYVNSADLYWLRLTLKALHKDAKKAYKEERERRDSFWR